MNVLVLHSQVPFTTGGAEVLVNGLVSALDERGHTVDLVSLPLAWNPVDRLLTSALAWGLLDLSSFNAERVDRVICTKFPTWAVRHPRKSLWLIHQHRQAYDLHGTPLSEFSPNHESRNVRKNVREIDRRGIGECDHKFAISQNVARRLKHFNGLDAAPLYPPVPRSGLRPEAFEPFLLCVSRIDNAKRVDLIVDAFARTRSGLKLVIAGSGPGLDDLRARVDHLGVKDRVDVLGRVSDDRIRELYNTCRGVVYTPVDEDYGYAAVEALAAAKPVVTVADSGGLLEFVVDDVSGLVTDPNPDDVARCMDRLASEELARRLGASGPSLTRTLTWDTVVNSLLGDDETTG